MGLNLHRIVSGAIGAVNPHTPGTVRVSTGYGIGADGTQQPTYADPVDVTIQRQELTQRDLRQMANVNLQGVWTAAYVSGNYYGQVRDDGRGGDLFEFQGETWLLAKVLESWNGEWCKVALCQQLST